MLNPFQRPSALTCRQIEAQLTAYLNGGLPPDQAAVVRRHLAGCEACRQALSEAETLEQGLRAEAAQLAAPLEPLAFARIQETLYQHARRNRLMKRTQPILRAGAALLALAALAFGINFALQTTLQRENPSGSQPTPPPATAMPPTSAAQEPSAEAPAEAPAAEEDGAGAVITFGTFDFFKQNYEPLIEEFQKQNPGITVQVVTEDGSDYRRAASAADVTLMPVAYPQAAGYFLDLTPFVEGDRTFEPDDFWPGALDGCSDLDGRMYGLPLTVDPVGIYYEEAAFQEAGLPLPEPGWTWDDFRRAVTALTREAEGGIRYGFADNAFIEMPDDILLSSSLQARLVEGRGELDAQTLADELGWYVDLARAGELHTASTYPHQYTIGAAAEENADWAEAWNSGYRAWKEMFVNRPPAMWKGNLSHAMYAEMDLEVHPDGSMSGGGPMKRVLNQKGYGWAPYPVTPGGVENTTPSTVGCGVVSAGSKHPREAWAWLDFLSRQPFTPEWSWAAPARRSAAEATGYWNRLEPPVQEAVRFGLEHGWYDSRYFSEGMALNVAVLKAVAGESELAAALEGAAETAAALPAPEQPEEPIEVAAPKATPAPGETVIAYAQNHMLDPVMLETLAEEFHRQHPDVSVSLTGSSSLMSIAEQAQNYDCFPWYPPRPGESLQPVLSLDSFLAAEPDLAADFSPAQMEDYRQDGQTYALPLIEQPVLMYYNADLLAARGLQPPAADWTFDQLMELAAAAASGGEEPVYGLAVNFFYDEAEFLANGRGVLLADLTAAPPLVQLDGPEAEAFTRWLGEQAAAHVLFPVSPVAVGAMKTNNFEAARQLILDGRVAFWLSHPQLGTGGNYQIPATTFRVGVVPLPQMPPGMNWWNPPNPNGQYISSQAENPQTCWDWIVFLSEHPEAALGVPARRSMLDSPTWEAQVGTETAQAYRTVVADRSGLEENLSNRLGMAREWWLPVLAATFAGEDPAPLQAEAQHKTDTYLACLAASGVGPGDAPLEVEEQCQRQADPGGGG